MRKVPVQFVVELVAVGLSALVLGLVFSYLHFPNIPWMLLGFVGQRFVSELWKRTNLEEESKRL